MADLFPSERLQPSLLDRLADDEPQKKTESREKRVLTIQKLKRSVMRDLEWLLNALCLEASVDLEAYPRVQSSVLNFGVPDFTGRTAHDIDPSTLERILRRRIVFFEPRLLPRSLKVHVSNEADHNTIVIEIEGELWSQPVSERLYMKTILDLEMGDFHVQTGR